MSRFITILALACALVLAACGGEEDKPDPKVEVRETLQSFVTSIQDRDASKLCTLIDPEALEGLAGQGLPCEVAMREQFFSSVQAPELTVGEITVDGDRADAQVKFSAQGQAAGEQSLPLRRVDGDWKVSFSDDAEPAATAPAAPRKTPAPDPAPKQPASKD